MRLSMIVFILKVVKSWELYTRVWAECFRRGQKMLPQTCSAPSKQDATWRNLFIRPKVMRKCFNVKRPPTLQSWSRHFISTLPRGGLGDLAVELDAATKTSSEVEQKLATVHLEQLDEDNIQELGDDGKQQEELLSSHGLPLSPLMNPQLIAARNRHRVPKPQPSGPPSALTAKLQKNPYGINHCSHPQSNPANRFSSTSSSDPNPRMQPHRRTTSFRFPPGLRAGKTPGNGETVASP